MNVAKVSKFSESLQIPKDIVVTTSTTDLDIVTFPVILFISWVSIYSN